jgi:hypothetical protein
MASADSIALDLGTNGTRVEWTTDGVRALGAAAASGPQAPVWRLEGELDWDAFDSLRVVSAAFEDGRLLALVALHPAEAAGHDEAVLRGALVEPEGDVLELAEALLSTQYDSDGSPTRIGLELYTDPEAVPLRVAADRERGDETPQAERAEQERRAVIPMSFRMEGARGAGLLELVSRRG